MSTLFGLINNSNISGLKNAASMANAMNAGEAIGGKNLKLARTDERHFATGGGNSALGVEIDHSFDSAMLKAMDGVNAMQNESSSAVEAMMVNPDSVDAHDVTIAMAKASMSLNITRTVLDRVVRAWKDVINTR